MDFLYEAEGFEYNDAIWNQEIDLSGYTGYHPGDDAVYAVFRGARSEINWVTINDDKLVTFWGMPDCQCRVHKGYQIAA